MQAKIHPHLSRILVADSHVGTRDHVVGSQSRTQIAQRIARVAVLFLEAQVALGTTYKLFGNNPGFIPTGEFGREHLGDGRGKPIVVLERREILESEHCNRGAKIEILLRRIPGRRRANLSTQSGPCEEDNGRYNQRQRDCHLPFPPL